MEKVLIQPDLDKLGFSPAQQELLLQLEKTQKDFWNISRETANFLNMLIKVSGCKNALEIGTSNGYSGIWIAKALKQTNGKLTTIEYWEKRLSLAQENFKTCEVDDVITILQGSACDILQELEETYDFVFIDANKTEYLKYFELIVPKLKQGAIIAADNINSHREKVEDFIQAIKANKNFQVEILDLPGGLLLGLFLSN